MKRRLGFVSNSSSSSFIVIDFAPYTPIESISKFVNDSNEFVIGEWGCTEFGWDETKYSSMFDRINFAWLQTEYIDKPEWKEMLEDVLKEYFQCEKVTSKISTEYDCRKSQVWGYIDHQSAAGEGANIGMFDNKENLKAFLFGAESFIQGDNDNH